MADYSYLLAGKPIEAPNPMALAGQAMTLGNLGIGMQEKQLQLQAMQQMPRALQMLYAGGSGDGGSPDGGQSQDPVAMLQQVAQKFPQAYMQLAPMILGQQKTIAETGASNAAAAENRRKVQDAQLQKLGNYADDAANNPTADKYFSALRQLKFTGLPIDTFGTPPDPSSATADDVVNWLKGVKSAVVTPEARNTILTATTKLPGELAATAATTAKTQQETAQMPRELAIKEMGADTERWKYLSGNLVEDKNNGDQYQVAPQIGPDGQPRMVATPVSTTQKQQDNPQGGVLSPSQLAVAATDARKSGVAQFQVPTAGGNTMVSTASVPQAPQPGTFRPGVPAATQALLDTNAKTAAALEAKIPDAMQALHSLQNMHADMRNNAGIFAGPVYGADFFRNMAGIVSQIPGMPQSLVDKVSNTQEWQTHTGELAFQMLEQLGPSAARSPGVLHAIQEIKPTLPMTPQTQEAVMNAIEATFRYRINWASAASAAARNGQTISQVPEPAGGLPTRAGTAGPYGVAAPDGKTYTFPSESAAMEFKVKAGLR